ncbi:hypothetical protein FLACHUCJ7_04053 [Flavobacterium chungangense]|uniref:DUF2752 domain-containing protein n=1 Tax=Flavobacterium chungangense TaxID=554283 RepID=A0A6V6ZDQ9_9FLAO|nr:hypothetical protein FLACHUCJ7_04053 [Flavobacterium chungangense]
MKQIKSSYELESYKKINIIFALLIMFIFFYSYLSPYISFRLSSSCHGLPQTYCKSRGLTRAFSQILRLNFEKAILFNVYSIKVFLFFLIQLIVRFFLNVIVKLSNFKLLIFSDAIFSLLFFLFSFYDLVLI